MTIEATEFKQYPFPAQGATSLDWGVYLVAKDKQSGLELAKIFVGADVRFEPETRNQLGTLGAYRDIYPSDERIKTATKKLRATALRILNN